MSPRRASQPPPLPPLRACPATSLAGARDVPGQTLAAPSRSRRGHKYNKQTIKTINTSATNVPTPTPSPASRLPGNVPRWRSGRARSDARCPLPLPAGALITSIHTFQHNYCVSCLPHPANDFFFLCFLCSVIHLGPCLASLRPGPRRTPSQRFCGCAHHR